MQKKSQTQPRIDRMRGNKGFGIDTNAQKELRLFRENHICKSVMAKSNRCNFGSHAMETIMGVIVLLWQITLCRPCLNGTTSALARLGCYGAPVMQHATRKRGNTQIAESNALLLKLNT